MSDWKTFEPFTAPGRVKTERLRFSVSQEFVDTHFQIHKLTPLFQAKTHLYATLPNVNLIRLVAASVPPPTLTTLDDAYACFEGIRRPHDDEDNGDSVLVYVMRPSVTVESHLSMACQVRAVTPPTKTVLTVLVRTNKGLHDDGGAIDGCVTRLEWVFAEGENILLPKGANMRYTAQHW